MFEIRLLVISLLLTFGINFGIEKWHVADFKSVGEIVAVNYITDTPLYSRNGCSGISVENKRLNIGEVQGALLCECPSPDLTGKLDIYGRLLSDGRSQYLCVDGWYKKVVNFEPK